MSKRFEVLDSRTTPMGEISLRRRLDPMVKAEVYEVKLGDEFLMSSLFTTGEIELARLGLAAVTAASGTRLDVVVGGLGLGHTGAAVLDDPRVGSLRVVETLGEVIEWHRRGLIPLATGLTADPRTELVHGDFFALAREGAGFDVRLPGRRFHAVLLDIDHSPRHLLHRDHATFYTARGLTELREHLYPGGVFALWSDDPPDETFTALLRDVFSVGDAHVVRFPNPVAGGQAANTVYVAVRAADPETLSSHARRGRTRL